MKRIEKGTWHSRVEEILCRDFGNVYSKLTGITQHLLLDSTSVEKHTLSVVNHPLNVS